LVFIGKTVCNMRLEDLLSEKELMLNEFMDRFGNAVAGLVSHTEFLLVATGNGEVIVPSYRLPDYANYAPWFKVEKITDLLTEYAVLKGIVDYQYKEKNQHSKHFQWVKSLVDQISEPLVSLKQCSESTSETAAVLRLNELGAEVKQLYGLLLEVNRAIELYYTVVSQDVGRAHFLDKHPDVAVRYGKRKV